MKKNLTLWGLAFVVNCLCSTESFAFVFLKTTETTAITPPQYFTSKTTILEQFLNKKITRANESIDLNKKIKWTLFASILSLLAFLGLTFLMIFIVRRNWIVISLWALNLHGCAFLFGRALSLYREKNLTARQRRRSKASVIINLFTLSLAALLALAALVFVFYFIFVLISII